MISKEKDWNVIIFMAIFHILAICGIFFVNWDLSLESSAFMLAYMSLTHLSFMSGWHRYYAHRSYVPTRLFEILILFFGSSIFTGSVEDWIGEHVSHHANPEDDKKDPTNINRGFFYSHIGWLFYKKNFSCPKKLSSELTKLHDKYWMLVAIVSGLIVPVSILSYLGNDLKTSIFLGGFIRIVFSQHCLFLVGSWSHMIGSKMKGETATNSLFVSIMCFGEGYHLNHHRNPADYRAGFNWYDYDPGKWFLYIAYKLGLIRSLKAFKRK